MADTRGRFVAGSAIVLALLVAAPAAGEDLSGATRLLCVPGRVSHCIDGQGCKYGPPEHINVPGFIEVDLASKALTTTRASGENRSTSVDHLTREDGNIYLQGVEDGRAYTMVIAESSGDLAFTVVTNRKAATMFGQCTPSWESDRSR